MLARSLRPLALLAPLFLLACASRQHMAKTQKEGEMLRVELAQTYVQRGAYDAALPLVTRALVEQPKEPLLHTLHAIILRERGLYPQSEKAFRTAVRLAPRAAAAWAGLGVLLDLTHRGREAEAAHRRALALAPDNAEVWNNLGFSLYLQARTDEAILALEKALALDPGLVVAYNNLGFAYGKRGDLEAARRLFASGSTEAGALMNLALVAELRGDAELAVRLRAEAVAKDPRLKESTP